MLPALDTMQPGDMQEEKRKANRMRSIEAIRQHKEAEDAAAQAAGQAPTGKPGLQGSTQQSCRISERSLPWTALRLGGSAQVAATAHPSSGLPQAI